MFQIIIPHHGALGDWLRQMPLQISSYLSRFRFVFDEKAEFKGQPPIFSATKSTPRRSALLCIAVHCIALQMAFPLPQSTNIRIIVYAKMTDAATASY